MGERSSRLRKLLVESVRPEHIGKEYQNEFELRYIDDSRREQLRSNMEEERSHIADFENKHQFLLGNFEVMTDDEFAAAYEEAKRESDVILARIKRYSQEYQEERPYTVGFVEINKIESLGDFLERFPMEFIPRKQEIGRILAIAKQMHQIRISREESDKSEPIRIVDIGGANGALGKLITDIARENEIEIEYTVVDPDALTVRAAAQCYAEDPMLHFKEQTGDGFIREMYSGNEEILALMEERQKLIQKGEEKRADLKRVLDDIHQRDAESLDPTTIRLYLHMLKTDFGIILSDELPDDPQAFLEAFEDDFDMFPSRSFIDKYMDSWKEQVDVMSLNIESLTSKEPTQFDLVINSWMPVSMDLTKEVRGANGAAILYAIEQYGATGCRSDAPYPSRSTHLGQGESYHPGDNNESQLAWISHSTPQVCNMQSSQPNRLWEYQNSWTAPFSNGFIVQTKKDYVGRNFSVHPEDWGIIVEGEYPWEKELGEKGGDISPTIPLSDIDGKLDCYSPLSDLASQLEDWERAKRSRKSMAS